MPTVIAVTEDKAPTTPAAVPTPVVATALENIAPTVPPATNVTPLTNYLNLNVPNGSAKLTGSPFA